MTVPYFVPSRTDPCIGYIGAITGSAKTFTADDLAVAIASGGLFAGQQVTERGVVVLVEMEGSSRVRLKAAIQYRGVEEFKLPIYHSQKMPPVILNKGEISKEWKDWCIRTIRLVRWQINREYPELPLTAIILDPLAHFSGITDIGSFGENTAVSKALIDLALKAACLVVIVDHYGKDTTRGLIGSIARESPAYFVLTPGDKLGGDLSKSRQLVIRKMRDGLNNICVDCLNAPDDVACRANHRGAVGHGAENWEKGPGPTGKVYARARSLSAPFFCGDFLEGDVA